MRSASRPAPAARTGSGTRLAAAALAVTLAAGLGGCSDPASAGAGTAGPARPAAQAAAAAAAVRSVAARPSYAIFAVTGTSCRLSSGLNTGRVVPIASVYKLWILDALAREIAAGRASWDQTFPVQDRWRSDPSGEVYAMPAGTALSLRRYAELMISISDNSAADHLLARLGRQRVEQVLPLIGVTTAPRDIPLLSTADMARLKFLAPATGGRYLSLGSVTSRRRFLSQLPALVPMPVLQPGGTPPAVDLSRPSRIDQLEWFATPADLCRTMADLAALSRRPGLSPLARILAINPGVPPDIARQWAAIWFKGGSEPGVITLAYWLTRPGGRHVAVILAWSHPAKLITPGPAGDRAIRAVLALALAATAP